MSESETQDSQHPRPEGHGFRKKRSTQTTRPRLKPGGAYQFTGNLSLKRSVIEDGAGSGIRTHL